MCSLATVAARAAAARPAPWKLSLTKPTSAPPLGGLHHITLPVGDLHEAETFHVEVLGARLLRRIDREAFVGFNPERAHEVTLTTALELVTLGYPGQVTVGPPDLSQLGL